MKKRKVIIFTSLIAVLAIIYPPKSMDARTNGSPGGRSSSTGDNNSSCGQGGCHGGGHIVDQSGYISSDIPGSGYIPGNTYNITLSGNGRNKTKIGFEFSAENLSGVTSGSLIANSNGRNQLLGTLGHLTHTNSGTNVPSGNFNWTFQWTAPAQGAGDIKFSSAVLFTNSNGQSSGDSTRIASLIISEDQTTTVSTLGYLELNVYPNPTSDKISLNNTSPIQLNIIDSKGTTVYTKKVESFENVDVSFLPKGIYYLSTFTNSGKIGFSEKLIKL